MRAPDLTILEFQGVGKTYPAVGAGADVRALERVDLSVCRGEFISFVGPSGCGKTTLLNIAAALLPPSEGQVRYRSEPMLKPNRQVGIMFQTPVLLPWRTVERNALLPAEIYGLPLASIREKVQRVIELVGLSEFSGAYPHQLSGGMQQRAALGRVLAYEPDVLLMDEPFGALDEFTREAMNLQLMELTQRTGITVLFVTHNITEAVFLADRVVVMNTRPGRVSGVVDVPFDQPRQIETMRRPEFTELSFRVRQLLGNAA